jgi:hypothetical protein
MAGMFPLSDWMCFVYPDEILEKIVDFVVADTIYPGGDSQLNNPHNFFTYRQHYPPHLKTITY